MNLLPHIIPIKDLQNTSKIAKMVEESHRPIIVTKNGYDKMVIMSTRAYQQQFLKAYVDEQLEQSRKEIENGAELTDAFEFLKEMEAEYGF